MFKRFFLSLIGNELTGNTTDRTTPSEDLEDLPVGLVVEITPNPVKARKVIDKTLSYRWVWEITVRAKGSGVRITEFGYFVRRDLRWVFSIKGDRPCNSEEFEVWYRCPGAYIEPFRSYHSINTNNYEILRNFTYRIYFIGN